jgi:hypothetical protein
LTYFVKHQEDNIKTDIEPTGWKGVNWIHLFRTGNCEHSTEPFNSTTASQEELYSMQLLLALAKQMRTIKVICIPCRSDVFTAVDMMVTVFSDVKSCSLAVIDISEERAASRSGYPKNGDRRLLRNVDNYIYEFMASHCKRQ